MDLSFLLQCRDSFLSFNCFKQIQWARFRMQFCRLKLIQGELPWSLSFSFAALYCTVNQWRKQNRPKEQVLFFSGFLVGWLAFSSWDYFFWMLQDPKLAVLLSYKAQTRRDKFSLAWNCSPRLRENNLLKMRIFCHGLVTKKTYSGIPNFVSFSSHAISCALLPQIVFKIFSTSWNVV